VRWIDRHDGIVLVHILHFAFVFMHVFVIASFTVIIPNANQVAWLSGGLLKKSHPNAEVGLCGTTRRQRLSRW
jgi:hypothetical protein